MAFLGVLVAFALFGGLVAQNETGVDVLSYGPHKLCQVMGGEYAKERVNTVGRNKEYSDAKSSVPFCTAGPSTLIEGALE